MSDEAVYRFLVAALVLVGIGTSGFLRRRADRQGGAVRKEADDREPDGGEDTDRGRGPGGRLLLVLLRAVGLAALGMLGIYVAVPDWTEPLRWIPPAAIRQAAAALSVVSLGLALWAVYSLGPNVTPTERTREGHHLVVHGPYRWIRHPLYTFGALFWLGVIAMTGLWPLALLIAVAWGFLLARVPREEAALEVEFGDRYRRYAARTGRFLPRIGGD